MKIHVPMMLAALIVQGAGIAQPLPSPPDARGEERRSVQVERAASLTAYVSASRDAGDDAILLLESLYASGLDKTPENFGEIVRLLDTEVPNDHKALLIRLLASFHAKDGPRSLREEARRHLRLLAGSGDKALATAALMSYSRLGYLPDTESLLETQLKRGFISKDDAYGELAHLTHLAPQGAQKHLIEKIGDSRNAYAIDILASNVHDDDARRYMSADAKRALQTVLEQNQPVLTGAMGEFSLMEAIVYSDWLHALASLTTENTGTAYDDVIMSHLEGPTSNPKKAISYFLSDAGKVAARRIGKAKLSGVLQRIAALSNNLPYPQNSDVRDFSESVMNFTNAMAQ